MSGRSGFFVCGVVLADRLFKRQAFYRLQAAAVVYDDRAVVLPYAHKGKGSFLRELYVHRLLARLRGELTGDLEGLLVYELDGIRVRVDPDMGGVLVGPGDIAPPPHFSFLFPL